MTDNFNSDQIKKRLEELDFLEKVENTKLETLREQKKGEIETTIDPEIKKNKEKAKRKLHKLRKAGLIVTIGAAGVIGIYKHGKQAAKDEVNRKTQKEIGVGDSTSLPKKTYITSDSLRSYIPRDKIDQKLSYENLAQILNEIKNEKVKTTVFECLKRGNIYEAQELFGMKRVSQYPSNKATGKIDFATLERFADPFFGLQGKELLDNADIPEDVKIYYQKFVSRELYNNQASYIIISKTDFNLYLFTKDHILLNRQVTLLGKDFNKEGERVPYDHYNTNKGVIYHNKEVNTNTPEGLFLIKETGQLSSNYISDGPKIALILFPIDNKTQKIIKNKYDLMRYALEIHPIYQPPEDPTKYAEAIESEDIDDNTQSHGCPNIKHNGIVTDNVTIAESVVIITDEPKNE